MSGGSLLAQPDAAPETTAVNPDRSSWSFGNVIDQLPSFVADRLPFLDPDGTVEISVRPHLGDFFHDGYVRVPVGVRWKVTDHFSLNTELNNYFSQGSANAERSGISGITLGAKCEHLLSALLDGGISAGLDYRTPFNNSPRVFTDGYRHVQPFVAVTHMLVPKWKLLGYGSLAANFFEHTNLPSAFGRNQLHANSLALTVGAARRWSRFYASLTARIASTELMSDEGRQNFQLRPEVSFPLRRANARTQILLSLGGRVMWGPDGMQTNTNGGVRVLFHLDHKNRSSQDEPARFPM